MASRDIWDMGQLPFHMGPLSGAQREGFPARMPFHVGFDEELGLFTQVYDQGVMDTLRDVYVRGSQLGVPMGDRGLGKSYADDFQRAIEEWLGGDLTAASLLEIGSGSGHLLGSLADAGAEVAGVELDPRCRELMAERGIPVATCAFEDFRADRTYDCVVHYCVMEHLPDPVAFLRAQGSLLGAGGRVICAVPDCSEGLRDGDVSIFIHQHWSYFSEGSLRRLAAAAGLRVEAVRRADVGGLLYVSMVDAEAPPPPASATAAATASASTLASASTTASAAATGEAEEQAKEGQPEPQEFVARGRLAMARFDRYVRRVLEAGRSLGVYCPEKAINYLPADAAAYRSVRLFDDSPLLTGRHVPPFALTVEDGTGLERQGVEEILIMSRSFGEVIEAAIGARNVSPRPRIVHIGDVLSHD